MIQYPVHTTRRKVGKQIYFSVAMPTVYTDPLRDRTELFENAFQTRRDLKTPALRVSLNGKYVENGTSVQKRWRHQNYLISLPELLATTTLSLDHKLA